MKKTWSKPVCTTLMASELSAHIKAAAWSEDGICKQFVLR